MGYWNETCALTSAAIREDEQVVALVVRKDIENCWQLHGVPLYGEYDGYGTILLIPNQEHKAALFPKVNNLLTFLDDISKEETAEYQFPLVAIEFDLIFIKADIFTSMLKYFGDITTTDWYLPSIANGLSLKEHLIKEISPYLLKGSIYSLNNRGTLSPEDEDEFFQEKTRAELYIKHLFVTVNALTPEQIDCSVDMSITDLMFKLLRKPLTPGVARGSQDENQIYLKQLKDISEICGIFEPDDEDY